MAQLRVNVHLKYIQLNIASKLLGNCHYVCHDGVCQRVSFFDQLKMALFIHVYRWNTSINTFVTITKYINFDFKVI